MMPPDHGGEKGAGEKMAYITRVSIGADRETALSLEIKSDAPIALKTLIATLTNFSRSLDATANGMGVPRKERPVWHIYALSMTEEQTQ